MAATGHRSWAATLATEYHQRSRVFGVLAAAGVLGAVVVLLIPIAAGHIGWTDAQGVRAMGWFILGMITSGAHVLPMQLSALPSKPYLPLLTSYPLSD